MTYKVDLPEPLLSQLDQLCADLAQIAQSAAEDAATQRSYVADLKEKRGFHMDISEEEVESRKLEGLAADAKKDPELLANCLGLLQTGFTDAGHAYSVLNQMVSMAETLVNMRNDDRLQKLMQETEFQDALAAAEKDKAAGIKTEKKTFAEVVEMDKKRNLLLGLSFSSLPRH